MPYFKKNTLHLQNILHAPSKNLLSVMFTSISTLQWSLQFLISTNIKRAPVILREHKAAHKHSTHDKITNNSRERLVCMQENC